MPAGLAAHNVYATGDPGTAEILGRPLLGSHRLRVQGPAREGGLDGKFSASLHAAPVGSVTLGYLSFGRSTEIVLVDPPRFLVLVPTEGRAAVWAANKSVVATPRKAVVIGPGSSATVRCDESVAHLVVGIDRLALLAHLGRLLGRDLDKPLAFDLELDLADRCSARWNVAVELLHVELSEPRSLLRSGIGLGQMQEFLMSSLLYGHRSSYSAALRGSCPGIDQRATRAARGFIEAHLREPLSVAAVASAAGVSARTLQATFRSELGTTPTTYIRDRRLDGVRGDLADAQPSEHVTVTFVATRWGITHLGRFAADYRARFGESPSQTLRS